MSAKSGTRAPARTGKAIHANLALPPSANRLWRKGRDGQIYIDSKYAAWKKSAAWELAAAYKGAVRPIQTYSLILHLPEKMRGDIDNRVKAVNDLMKAAGLIVDDRFCRDLTIFRADTVEPGRCHVAVFPHSYPAPVEIKN